jgi:hypothetical protein
MSLHDILLSTCRNYSQACKNFNFLTSFLWDALEGSLILFESVQYEMFSGWN